MNKEVVIIPTYNEKENILNHLSVLTKMYGEMEIVVVDDSSPDGTAELVREFALSHPAVSLWVRKEKTGLGDAYKYALARLVLRADIKNIYTMDADGSHQPKHLNDLRQALKDETGACLVVGSRYVPGGGIENWGLVRRWLSKFGNLYAKYLLGVPINDLTAGFAGFSRQALQKININSIASTGYAYQIEFKYRLIKAGAKVKETPIIFSERALGKSKMSLGIALEGVTIPWRIRFGRNKILG